MGGEGRRDGAELRDERKPCNSAVGHEKMTPVGGGRGRYETGIGNRKGGQGAEMHGKVGDKGMKRIRNNAGWDGCSARRSCKSRSRRGRSRVGGNRGDTFQRVSGGENSGIVGGRPDRAVSKVKLKSNLEVLGNERVVEASEAVDVFHHMSWPMEYLKEVAKKLLSPSTDLMDRPVILQDFFDGAAIAKPKDFSAPNKFAVPTNGPAPTAGFTDKWMEVTFSLGAAAGA
jgi:hypothetical protein